MTIVDPDPVMAASEASERAESSRTLISALICSTANARSFGPKNLPEVSTSREVARANFSSSRAARPRAR